MTLALTNRASVVFDGFDGAGAPRQISPEDAATWGTEIERSIDAAVSLAGMAINWTHETVRVRSTGNVNISNALENGDTLNGVVLATGNHVFLPFQTDPTQNGIYTVVASGAASRATWANSAAELDRLGFFLQEGTAGAGERWVLPLAAASITVGTTALNFAQVGAESDLGDIDARLTAAESDIDDLETAVAAIEPGADVTDAGNVGATIAAVDTKVTPVAGDVFAILDSEASNALTRLTWENLLGGARTALGAMIAAVTGKTTPVDADLLVISDSAASNATKKVTIANFKAILWTGFGALIAGGTGKTTPVDADTLALSDSAASNATKKVTIANFKATLKTYFDGVYIGSASVAQTQGRPGDVLLRFAATLTGDASAAAVPSGSVATNANGAVLRVTGAAVTALRERIAVEAGRKYKIRWAVQRNTNPTDPAGDTVRLAIQWLTSSKTSNGQLTDATLDLLLVVADGRQVREIIVGSDDSVIGVDFEWPASTVYMVPFIQTFGLDGITDKEIIECVDITDFDTASVTAGLDDHLADTANPHAVTKTQVGLGNVTNNLQATKAEFDDHVEDFDEFVVATGEDFARLPQPLLSPTTAVEVRDEETGALLFGVDKHYGEVIAVPGAPLLDSLWQHVERYDNGAVLRAKDKFGVEAEARIWDAWIAGGQAYLWHHLRGVTQLTDDQVNDWIKAEIRGGQLVLVRDDGYRVVEPLSGDITAYDAAIDTIIGAISYGQSNDAGNAATSIVSDEPVRPGVVGMTGHAMRAMGHALGHSQIRDYPMLLDQHVIQDISPAYEQLMLDGGETPNSSFGWLMTGAPGALAANIGLLLNCSAIGSANMAMLLPAASTAPSAINPIGKPWALLSRIFQRMALITRLRGYTFIAGPLGFNQGEGDITDTQAEYEQHLVDLQAGWQLLAQTWSALMPTGTHAGKAPIIVTQTSNGPHYSEIDTEVPWAQLKKNKDDPSKFLCAGPVYDQVHAADGVHLLADGQVMQGARRAMAYKVWLAGGTWKPLHVTSAVRTGTSVILTIHNPLGSALVFDTNIISGLGADEGFKWIDAGDGNAVTVTAAAINSDTEVELTLSDVPTGTVPYIYVGRTGANGEDAGPDSGNRSTLRDSGDGSETIDGRDVYNFICFDRIPVTT